MGYVTSATTKGGRNGRAMLDNGALALAMALPKELGGAGDGHNPEQLFALGYSACFGQAILVVAKKHGIDPASAQVGVAVTLHTDNNDFKLSAEITLKVAGADKAAVEALLADAHTICPYSKATRGNIPVTLTAL